MVVNRPINHARVTQATLAFFLTLLNGCIDSREGTYQAPETPNMGPVIGFLYFF